MVIDNFNVNNEKNQNNQLSIIIRTLGFNNYNLERAIFSIFCSSYKDLQIIVVYQGLNKDFEKYFCYLKDLFNSIDFVLVVNNNVNQDQRAKNINLGISNSSGRFIAFLDDDDFISDFHYEELINLLTTKKYVWGYSYTITNVYDENYLIAKADIYEKDYDYKTILNHNFIPIHSFIFDRMALSIYDNICFVDESLTRLEDYFILLNLASRYNPIINRKFGVFYNISYQKLTKNLDYENEFTVSRNKINLIKKEIVDYATKEGSKSDKFNTKIVNRILKKKITEYSFKSLNQEQNNQLIGQFYNKKFKCVNNSLFSLLNHIRINLFRLFRKRRLKIIKNKL